MCDDPHEFFRQRFLEGTATPEDFRQLTERLWQSYGQQVFVLAQAKLKRIEDARDICQDTFLRAIEWLQEHPDQIPSQVNFPAWLKRIACNLIIDRFRKPALKREKNYQHFAVEQAHTTDQQWRDQKNAGPLEQVLQGEQLDALHDCLEEQTERSRTMIVLRELKGLSYEAISKETSLSINTIGAILHRVRRQLRDCVELRLSQ